MNQLLMLFFMSVISLSAHSSDSIILDLSDGDISDEVEAEILQDIPFRTDTWAITYLGISLKQYDPAESREDIANRKGCHIQKVRSQERYSPENYVIADNTVILQAGTRLTSTTGHVTVLAKVWESDFQFLTMHFYAENSPLKYAGYKDFDFTLTCNKDFGIEAQESTFKAEKIDLKLVNQFLKPYIKLSLTN